MVRALVLLALCGGFAWPGAALGQAPGAPGEPVNEALFPADLLPVDRPEPVVTVTQLAADSVIYPAPTVPLRFAHAQHRGIDCARCHAAATSARPGDRLLPAEAVCLECHPTPAGEAAAASCASCHLDYRPEVLPDPAVTTSARPMPAAIDWPVAALRFGHAPHLARGARCADCHGAVAGSTSADQRFMPAMATCVDCHVAQGASLRCATCHPSGADGLLRTALPGGRLVPEGGFTADHRGDFATRHGPLARTGAGDCAACHGSPTSDPGCRDCHLGHVKPAALHPADYIRTHGVEAARDPASCVGCHRETSDCAVCHAQSGVALGVGPRAFGSTDGAARFHPVGFAGEAGAPPGPNHHQYAARRNLTACVSCHQEDDCVVCHSAGAPVSLSAGSPHPPGFSCAGALDANPRGCLKCHADRAALQRLCDR